MAGRVNKQFVISLSVGLALVFSVVAASAYYLLVNSAADLAKAGDRLAAQGEYDKAIEYYAKAVNKEQTNSGNLAKWRDALKQLAPETQVVYNDYYRQYHMATRQLARVQRDNIEVQRENLELQKGMMLQGEFSRSARDQYVIECDAMISLHAGEPAGSPSDVLKRFRGAAKCELFAFVPDAKIEVANEAEADLIAALAADPADTESALALQMLYRVMADRATARSAMDEAAALREKADGVVTAFLAKNPDDPRMMMMGVQRDLVNMQLVVYEASKRGTVDINEAVRKMQTDLTPGLDLVMESVRKIDPARLTPQVVESMRGLEALLDPTSRFARAEEICRIALTHRPNDDMLLATRADLFAANENYVAAIEQLQKIIELDLPKTSLEGLRLFGMKTNALYMQALLQAKSWHTTPVDERPAALDRAMEFRKQLGAVMASDAPQLGLVDAQIAVAQGDLATANRLLDQYLTQTRGRAGVDALLLAAQVADRLNQSGLAKQRLESLLAVSPRQPQAIVMLAEIETKLQNLDRADELYTQLLSVAPDLEEIKKRKALLDLVRSGGRTEGSDPVVRDLLLAQELLMPPAGKAARPEEFIPFLEKAVERNNYDWRLVQPLGNAYLRRNERDKAIALAAKGVERHPDSNEAKIYQAGVQAPPDSAEGRIAMINLDTRAPEIERRLAVYQVYRNHGMLTEAAAALAEAAAVDKSDPRVVDAQFMEALESKNLTVAKDLAERAKNENLDQAGGLTYQARLFLFDNRVKEAIVAMEQAVAKSATESQSWRLKGRLERLDGRPLQAMESFRQAVRLRPDDIGAVNELLGVLISLKRMDDALTLARQSEKYGRENPEFINVWLSLEMRVGSKSVARDRREMTAQNAPNDRGNLLGLAAIYVSDRDWAKARPVIDRARAIRDGLDVLAMDAAWNWEQGDRQKARSLFEDYIAKVEPAEDRFRPLLEYSAFLMQQQEFEATLVQLEKARAYQDPSTAMADRLIADVYSRVRAHDSVVEVCRRIVGANADTPDLDYHKRLAESLIRLKNFEDAQTEIDKIIAKKGKSDAVTLMLQADCQGGLGNTKGQRDILDSAVAQFPADPVVFYKRGQAQMGDPKTARDAISDFGITLQLQPDNWSAYRLRADAYVLLGQTEDAIKDLSAAIKLEPYNDELLFGLIADLLRMNRATDAFDIATSAIAKRDRDVNAMVTVGELFARAGAHREACRFLKEAFEVDTADRFAQRYLESLLALSPPDLNEAKRVLNVIGSQRIQANPGFLMALARMLMGQNQVAQAEAAAVDALKLLKVDQAPMMLAWFNDLRRLIPARAQLLRYLDETARIAQAALAQEWIAYFRSIVNLENEATRAAALSGSRDLLGTVKDSSIRQLLYRSVGSALVAQEDYTEAARVYRDGLGQFPEDVELNNNLAYILAIHLDKAAEAEPLAEKAAALNPAVADILDTLGSVKLILKKCDESVVAFRKATLLSSTPEQSVRYHLHLADAYLCGGQRSEARAAVSEAKMTVDKEPSSVSEKAKAELEAARKKVEGN